MDENDNEESNLHEIVLVKKVVDIDLKNNTEEQIEEKLNEMTGHTVKVDYSINDGNRFIAVSIHKTE